MPWHTFGTVPTETTNCDEPHLHGRFGRIHNGSHSGSSPLGSCPLSMPAVRWIGPAVLVSHCSTWPSCTKPYSCLVFYISEPHIFRWRKKIIHSMLARPQSRRGSWAFAGSEHRGQGFRSNCSVISFFFWCTHSRPTQRAKQCIVFRERLCLRTPVNSK